MSKKYIGQITSTNYTKSFSVTILAGATSSNFSACLYGYYISGGATVCGACVASCDNPSVSFTSNTY